jgi:NADH dehydrogenase (ubiquinone) 1 alpha subcomplex subunit 9
MPKRFYEQQRLQVYSEGSRNSISGIKACVFGGSSVLGTLTGGTLTQFGS